MPISRASRFSFAAACALHVVLVARIASRPIVVEPPAPEAAPLDIAFVELAEPAPREVTATVPAQTLAAPLAALAPPSQPGARPQAKPVDASAPATAASPEASPLVGAAEPSQGVLSPRRDAPAASTLAPSGPIAFGLPLGSFADGAPAPTGGGPVGPRVEQSARERPVDAAKILRAATDKHDVALGVGFGGPVAAAGRSALSSPSAPLGGRGRYEVRTNATGQIVAVRALDGDPAWQAFAATLQAVLAGRTLRVPEGARGVVVVVALEAHQQEVAGKGSSVMRFDIANLAAGPSRVVSARVESERTL